MSPWDTFGLAALSAGSIAVAHEAAHHVYGTTEVAIGTVGLVVLATAAIGVAINGAVVASRGDLAVGAFGALLAVSAVSAWGVHDVAHRVLGASFDAIVTISVILAAVTLVGTALNITSYMEGSA